MRLALDAGYEVFAYMQNEKAKIEDDPNFDARIKVVRYKNFLQMCVFLFKNRTATVYANSVTWQNFLLVPIICRRAVFMAHDSIARRSWLKQKIENFALKNYWRVRVIANGEKDFLLQQGIRNEKIFVAPLAIDTSLFSPGSTPGKDLVYLGNVTPDNDPKTILKALSLVLKSHPSTKLHIIGEVRMPEFSGWVKELNLENAIVHHGYVSHSELAKILPEFSIFVSSVISSGQHLAVFESALCGLALCLPDTMQFNSVFRDSALFHALYSSNELGNNILKYLSSPDLIKQHNEAARKLIVDKYSESVTNQGMINLFNF